jgi:hypothetical protein
MWRVVVFYRSLQSDIDLVKRANFQSPGFPGTLSEAGARHDYLALSDIHFVIRCVVTKLGCGNGPVI